MFSFHSYNKVPPSVQRLLSTLYNPVVPLGLLLQPRKTVKSRFPYSADHEQDCQPYVCVCVCVRGPYFGLYT